MSENNSKKRRFLQGTAVFDRRAHGRSRCEHSQCRDLIGYKQFGRSFATRVCCIAGRST